MCIYFGMAYSQVDTLERINNKNILREYPSLVRFETDSFNLNQEEIARLNVILRHIERRATTLDTFLIIINTCYCKEEVVTDPFLGIKRAKVVYDYLLKNTSVDPSKCLIRDDFWGYNPSYLSSYPCTGHYVRISMTPDPRLFDRN